MPAGPFQPTWDSIRQNYQMPKWFIDAKFGLFMHWGLYSVPAYHNEWYEKYMYNIFQQYHESTWGPLTTFGYKTSFRSSQSSSSMQMIGLAFQAVRRSVRCSDGAAP